MITNDDQFEHALEAALASSANPPPEGSAEHQHLMSLLQEIADYRPNIAAPPDPGVPSEDTRSAALTARLKRFEKQIAPHYGEHWSGMVGGDLKPH